MESSLDRLIPPEILQDELYALIERLARTEKLHNVLEIGSSAGQGSTAALVVGIRANPHRPRLFCLELSKVRFDALRQAYADVPQVHCYNASSVPLSAFPTEQEVSAFYHGADTTLRSFPLAEVLGWLAADKAYLANSELPDRGIEQIQRDHDIDRFDLVLIDGSEFTGRAELDLVYGARLILLDDVRGFKNAHNFQRLLADPAYILRQANGALRNGYAFFERIYLDRPGTLDMERPQRHMVVRRVRPGMTVFDVGANVGDYSVLFSRLVGPTGKVFAFEPASSTVAKLRQRLAAHECENVTVVQGAVYSENTEIDFNEFPDEYSVWNSLGKPRMVHPVNLKEIIPLERTERVRALRLDDFCREHQIPHIDFLKLDVEGAESDALLGATELLGRKAIDVIQFEISREMLTGMNRSARQVFDILQQHGYACYHVAEDGTLGGRVADSDAYYQNYVAIPELPVHFFTIVLNGEPFIRHHIEQFKKLGFKWHWHIIEGVADLKHDTAWSRQRGGRVPSELHRNGLSIDGTTEYVNQLIAEYPRHVTVYRRQDRFWDGKREMISQPLTQIGEECLLWQLDADELWTAEQLAAGRKLFLDHPEKTAAFYWCHFFVGPDRVITTRGGYANNPRMEWLRTWRFRPGMAWASHEPPILAEQVAPNQWRDVARVNPLLHEETERAGLVFQHYAYATLEQVRFKQAYYGYHNAVIGWSALQYAEDLPQPLRNFLPWVGDDTQVDRAAGNVREPLLVDISISPPRSSIQPRPLVIVDGVFFQFATTGIARVWWSILNEWVRAGFGENILLLDRAGTMPRIGGIRTRIVPLHTYHDLQAQRALLQHICDEERADVFISSYYTHPITTATVLLVHDMIPELFPEQFNPADAMWVEKTSALRYATRFVAVSENTKRDILKLLPQVRDDRITVAHPGVWPTFKPAGGEQVADFRNRFKLDHPYFLCVGVRQKYKNATALFDAFEHLPDPRAFQIACIGEDRVLLDKYLPLAERQIIRYLGRVDDPTLAIAYSGASALVYPSKYEGFGLPVIEAFACGCPVLAAATGSLPEVAGDAALYIDPEDPAAIARALLEIQNPDLRQRLAAAGFERVKRFRWDEMAAAVREVLLQTVVAGGKPA